MSTSLSTYLFACFFLITILQQHSAGEFEQWCIADEQTPDDELQAALDWACGRGGADCSKIQVNQPCYLPNTMKDHASYAFNNYYQKFKNKGATCYFKGSAMITELDPINKMVVIRKGTRQKTMCLKSGDHECEPLIVDEEIVFPKIIRICLFCISKWTKSYFLVLNKEEIVEMKSTRSTLETLSLASGSVFLIVLYSYYLLLKAS